jgi:hypothetical protein
MKRDSMKVAHIYQQQPNFGVMKKMSKNPLSDAQAKDSKHHLEGFLIEQP